MIPKGFVFAGVQCGLKNKRRDLGILLSTHPAKAAGVFTKNLVRASCVDYSQKALEDGELRAIVVNSGNANCCTGEQGQKNTEEMAALASKALDLPLNQIAVASTGVIGHQLDMEKVQTGIFDAASKFSENPAPFLEAILTTDLVEKSAFAELQDTSNNTSGFIYGTGKGSGMIAPNMATVMGFIATDLDVSEIDLKLALQKAIDKSFNSLTVDGDTSTNDMVLIMANGLSGVQPTAEDFQEKLDEVCISLAKQIAKDGEGATKLIEVHVKSSSDPKTIARTIANSPLVKTALFGCDPNWGRIMAAAGRSGVEFDVSKSRLSLEIQNQSYLLFEGGTPTGFDPKEVSTALKSDIVKIYLDLGPGEEATIYTCDFGYGYVRINAEYHT